MKDIEEFIVTLEREISSNKVQNKSYSMDYSSLDSLEYMTLISAIEKEFDIEFRDDITFDELSNYETLIAEIRKEICRHS